MWHLFGQSRQRQKQLEQRWHRIYRLAYAWCHDPHLASDLAQDTMLKAIRKRDQLQNAESLDAWLYSILNNCWKDYWRQQRNVVDIDAMHLSGGELETQHERNEQIVLVRRAITKLPMNQRQVVTLTDLEEMSYKDVATILDIPIGTVMSRLNRARQALRHILNDMQTLPDGSTTTLRRIK